MRMFDFHSVLQQDIPFACEASAAGFLAKLPPPQPVGFSRPPVKNTRRTTSA